MTEAKKTVWNAGVEVGPRDPFTKSDVSRIRAQLAKGGEKLLRDLAIFNTGIDTMLSVSDLLSLRVSDVMGKTGIKDVINVKLSTKRHETNKKITCTLSERTQASLMLWITKTGKKKNAYLFTGRSSAKLPITPRQLSRLVKMWATMINLDPTNYGTESLRRSRAVYIAHHTGNYNALSLLLGHSSTVSTVRYVADEVSSSNSIDIVAFSKKYEI